MKKQPYILTNPIDDDNEIKNDSYNFRQGNPLVSSAADGRNCRSIIKLFNKISNFFLI